MIKILLAVSILSMLAGCAAQEPFQMGVTNFQQPSESCVAEASKIADTMRGAANQIAGKPLQFEVVGQRVHLTNPGAMEVYDQSNYIVAEALINEHLLVVHQNLCREIASDKKITIAHEIGHFVDFAVHPFNQDEHESYLNWGDRPREIAASAEGHKIMAAIKGDVSDFDDKMAEAAAPITINDAVKNLTGYSHNFN